MQVRRQSVTSIFYLVAWLALPFLAASIGAIFRPGEWYLQLNKPSWTPPGSVFPPVWTTLYTLMGIAAWLVWRKGGFREHAVPLGLYLVQLFFNAIWSWLFFGLHQPWLGLIDIGYLWLALLGTVLAFFKTESLAGWLLVPYVLWVSFAFALNAAICRLN